MPNESKKILLDIRPLEIDGLYKLQHVVSATSSCQITDLAKGIAVIKIELTIGTGTVEDTSKTSNTPDETKLVPNALKTTTDFPLIYTDNKINYKQVGATELTLKFNFKEGGADLGSKPGGGTGTDIG